MSEQASALGEINLAIHVHLGQSINSGAINSDGRDSYRHLGILMQPNRGAFRLTLKRGRGGPLPYRVDSQMPVVLSGSEAISAILALQKERVFTDVR